MDPAERKVRHFANESNIEYFHATDGRPEKRKKGMHIFYLYFYIFLAQHNKLFFENIYSSFFWKKINREGTFIHTPSLVMTAFPSTVTLQECFSPDFKK